MGEASSLQDMGQEVKSPPPSHTHLSSTMLYLILNVTFYVENIAGEISRTLFVQCIFSFITRFITTTTLFLGQFTSSLQLGGGGRSAIQRTLGVDAITAGGGGGGADCLKKTGCGGGGRLNS